MTPLRPVPLGAWRYDTARRSKWALWGAMLFSIAFHLIVLFGFNRHTKKVKHVVTDDAVAVMLVMPDLKELEDQDPVPNDGETPPDQGLTVPTLADVPSQVDLSTSFVQQIDYSTLVPQQDLTTAKTLSIPTVIRHGGKIGDGLGKIFDLKDLDRKPEPIVQIAPVVPTGLKVVGTHVEISVKFVVDATGKAVRAEIVETTNYKYNECALVAIGKWKFRPGVKNGHRVPVNMLQPFIIDVSEAD